MDTWLDRTTTAAFRLLVVAMLLGIADHLEAIPPLGRFVFGAMGLIIAFFTYARASKDAGQTTPRGSLRQEDQL